MDHQRSKKCGNGATEVRSIDLNPDRSICVYSPYAEGKQIDLHEEKQGRSIDPPYGSIDLCEDAFAGEKQIDLHDVKQGRSIDPTYGSIDPCEDAIAELKQIDLYAKKNCRSIDPLCGSIDPRPTKPILASP